MYNIEDMYSLKKFLMSAFGFATPLMGFFAVGIFFYGPLEDFNVSNHEDFAAFSLSLSPDISMPIVFE